jgi:NADH-quinone oxidoreductase subunit J
LTASGPFSNMKTRPGEAFSAAIVALSLLLMLVFSVCSVDWKKVVAATNQGQAISDSQSVATGFNSSEEGNTVRPLGMALLGVRVDHGIGGESNANRAGYLLPFEIASMHLLVVLIGAAYLARAKRRVQEDEKL